MIRWFATIVVGIVVGLATVVGVSRMLVADALKPVPPATVWLDDMTWPEFRQALKGGVDTVIVPFAGTEQGGLHLVLGKHRHVVAAAAAQAAEELGGVLVAPVMPYAPEGAYAPADLNMALPGTMGLRAATLEAVAEDLALSLKTHGVKNIVFITDHGLSLAPLTAVAERLNAAWRAGGTRVLHAAGYYRDNGQVDWLRAQGFSDRQIGAHAGIRDTSELLLAYPAGVRKDRLYAPSIRFAETIGTDGDPSHASTDIGRKMIELKVKALVAAVRKLRAERTNSEK